MKITVKVNDRDVPNYYNRGTTEIHRTEKNTMKKLYIIIMPDELLVLNKFI